MCPPAPGGQALDQDAEGVEKADDAEDDQADGERLAAGADRVGESVANGGDGAHRGEQGIDEGAAFDDHEAHHAVGDHQEEKEERNRQAAKRVARPPAGDQGRVSPSSARRWATRSRSASSMPASAPRSRASQKGMRSLSPRSTASVT